MNKMPLTKFKQLFNLQGCSYSP